MNNQDLATTITKLGGVALIIISILNAASYIPYLVIRPEALWTTNFISAYLSKIILPALIGLGLIYFGGTLIRRHIPDTQVMQENLAALEKTALSVMGVLLLYYALGDMIVHLTQLYKANAMIKSGVPIHIEDQMGADTFSVIVATVFEIAFSLWLILGSGGMVNLFNRFRGR